jgi:hypothetical protein
MLSVQSTVNLVQAGRPWPESLGDKEGWKRLWQTENGKVFRAHLALMFVAAPPYYSPGDSDYQSYWWHLRDLVRRPDGYERVMAAMESAGKVATTTRPSSGSLRAHFEAQLRYEAEARDREGQRERAAKPIKALTPDETEEIRRDLRELRAKCEALTVAEQQRKYGPKSLLAGVEMRLRNWVAGR